MSGQLQGGGNAGPGQEVDVETPDLEDDDSGFWNPPEILSGPTTPDEEAETMLVEDYNWPEADADDAVPNGFWDGVSTAASGVTSLAGDAASAGSEAVPDPEVNIQLPDSFTAVVAVAVGAVLVWGFSQTEA
jgi:hypothetical protein